MAEEQAPAWAAYLDALRELHVEAGRPSSRAIARAAAQPTSHATVNDMLSGKRLPSLGHVQFVSEVLADIVHEGNRPAIKATVHRMSDLWKAAATEQGHRAGRGLPLPPGRPPTALEELHAIRLLLEELVELARKD